MSNLSKEIGNSKEDKNVEVIDVEALSDIVESELDNVAGGGYSQICGMHCKQVEEVPN